MTIAIAQEARWKSFLHHITHYVALVLERQLEVAVANDR